MDERAGFIRAIAESPEDDNVRLVWADWLQERGAEHEAVFVRRQIELYRMPGDPSLDARRDEVRHWLTRFIDSGDLVRWLGIEGDWHWSGDELAAVVCAGGIERTVRRGLVDELCLSWETWAQDSADIVADYPLAKTVQFTTPVLWEVTWGSGGDLLWLEGEPDPFLFSRDEVAGVCPPGNRVDEALLILRWPGIRFKLDFEDWQLPASHRIPRPAGRYTRRSSQ